MKKKSPPFSRCPKVVYCIEFFFSISLRCVYYYCAFKAKIKDIIYMGIHRHTWTIRVRVIVTNTRKICWKCCRPQSHIRVVGMRAWASGSVAIVWISCNNERRIERKWQYNNSKWADAFLPSNIGGKMKSYGVARGEWFEQ